MDNSTKYHTIAHIALCVLQEIYGKEVKCMGCNLSEERLRFDFSLDRKMTNDEKKDLVIGINNYIDQKLPVTKEEMTLEHARTIGAHGDFNDKYGELVFVYRIGNISCEICGGPHVRNTGELRHVKLIKEESSSHGVRRIKLIMEEE